MHDPVSAPRHYRSHPSGIECIEITQHMGFCLGNAIKYLFRHRYKGKPVEDLSKAVWYIEQELRRLTTESWAVYPFDPRYEVSTLGDVRRLGKSQSRKPVRIKNGYMTLSFNVGGRAKLRYVHRMVVETFVGAIPPDKEVCHKNNIQADNRLSNLRIDTPSGNRSDRRRHGSHFFGKNNPSAKLTEGEVDLIREAREVPDKELAARFGVNRATIGRIKSGEAWTDHRTEFDRNFSAIVDYEAGNVRDAWLCIWRADLKGDAVEDLRKAIWYLQAEITKRQMAPIPDDEVPGPEQPGA